MQLFFSHNPQGVFDLSRSRWYGLASSTCIARLGLSVASEGSRKMWVFCFFFPNLFNQLGEQETCCMPPLGVSNL